MGCWVDRGHISLSLSLTPHPHKHSCKLAKYCSIECQDAAWPQHEAACVAARAERKGKAAAAKEGGEAGGSGAGPSGL